MKFTKRPWKFLIRRVTAEKLKEIIEDVYEGKISPCIGNKYNFLIHGSIYDRCYTEPGRGGKEYHIHVTPLILDPEMHLTKLISELIGNHELKGKLIKHIEQMADEIER